MNDVYAARYNPSDPHHIAMMAALHRNRMAEAMNPDMRDMDGFPVAAYLQTAFIIKQGVPVGYLSIETKPRDGREPAAELIYLLPGFRQQGIAKQILEEARDACPQQLHAKGPLSEAGKALARSCGLPEDNWTTEQLAEAEENRAIAVSRLANACKHKRSNPAYACKKCQRFHAEGTAEVFIAMHALAINGPIGPAAEVAQRIINDNKRRAARLGHPYS